MDRFKRPPTGESFRDIGRGGEIIEDDSVEGHIMGDEIRDQDQDVEGHSRKRAMPDDEDVSGHGLAKRASDDDDTEGHSRKRAMPDDEDVSGHSYLRKASDDEDTEGHTVNKR